MGLVVTGLAAALLVPVGFAAAREPKAPDEAVVAPHPGRSYRLPAVEGDVSAERYWTETLDALTCIEAKGIATFGPYPSSDGRNIEYAFEASPRTDEVDAACLPSLMATGMAFASRAQESEVRRLVDLRSDLIECLRREGIDAGGGEGDRDGGGGGVGPDPERGLVYLDAGLQLASEEHPDVIRACARAVSP